MKRILVLTVFAAALLTGCAVEEETYPLTGAPCAPEDPVKDLRPLDCLPA